MQLTFKKLLLAFPLILVVLAAVSACDGSEEYDYKPTLATPQIVISESVINWGSIDHAACYEVYENSTLVKTVEETLYHIVQTAKGTYKYKVKALSADENYSSSKFSNEVVYVVTNDKLATPKISISNGVVSWEAVEHAGGYQVFEGGELVSQQSTTSYTVPHTETGVYKYTVKAISISGEYLASDLSNEVTHIVSERLTAPHISIAGKVISWQAVAHAETYVIYENGVVLYQAYTRTSYEIEQTRVGDYTYYVVARSSNPAYSMSENSNSVNYTIEPTVLATPDGLKVEDGQLEWTESVGAGYYEIYEDGIIVAKQSHSPYRIPIDHEPGTFSFTVKAFPAKDDKQYLESGISESCSHTVSDVRVQLATPANLRYDKREEYKNPALEDGTRPDEEKVTREFLVWDPVPNAGAYFVYENNECIMAVQNTEFEISEIMPGDHKYQVKAIATAAGFKSSELSEGYTYHIDVNSNTAFTIHLDLTYAPDFKSPVEVALYPIQQLGLPADNPIQNTQKSLVAGQTTVVINYTNIGRYVVKVTNLPSGYYASQIRLSAAATEGTVNIYSPSAIRTFSLNQDVMLTAGGGAGGSVGANQELLFVAPEKGQYQISATNGLLCTVDGVESYAFVADKGEGVYVVANCQNAGQSNLKITKMAKQYISFGEIGFDGATGPSNTIYNGQTEATFYLRASSEAKRYMIMFTTATMSNTRFAILTVNGKSYEFDGAYFNTQNILIPASTTDTEITVKLSGKAAGEGLGNVAFFVIPL